MHRLAIGSYEVQIARFLHWAEVADRKAASAEKAGEQTKRLRYVDKGYDFRFQAARLREASRRKPKENDTFAPSEQL